MQRHTSPRSILAVMALDLGLTATMLAVFSFHLTGLLLHEWAGVALCALLAAHLMVSWEWLAATTRRLLGPLPWRVRLRYLLNASLFVSLVVATITGVVISQALVPGALPMAGGRGFWRVLHTQSSNLTVLLMGLHLGVYWPSIATGVRRLRDAARRSRASGRVPAGASAR